MRGRRRGEALSCFLRVSFDDALVCPGRKLGVD
jgi:hypothetical protein